jgi:hypothetical protein
MSVSSCSVAVRDVHGYAYVRERFPETFIYRSVDIPDNPVCVSTECWLVADVTCYLNHPACSAEGVLSASCIKAKFSSIHTR